MRITVTIPAGLTDRESVEVARGFLKGVVAVNRMLIRSGKLKPMYRSGVRYRREPDGEESFVDALTTQRRGFGDCAHLAAWRVAELQEALAAAIRNGNVKNTSKLRWPSLRLYMRPASRSVHVQVRHSDGRIEDPSRLLGMGKAE